MPASPALTQAAMRRHALLRQATLDRLARVPVARVDDAGAAMFRAQAAAVVRQGQRAAATAMVGYLSAYTDARPSVNVNEVIAGARQGVPLEEVYQRPIVAARTVLSHGDPIGPAMDMLRGLARNLASTDVQLARTHAARAFGEAAPERVQAWRRVLSGSEHCGLCVLASTQRYRRGDLMPIHPGCDCGVEPVALDGDLRVVDDELLGQVRDQFGLARNAFGGPGRQETLDRLRSQLLAVNEHGEYGPTLAVKGQRFTGPTDI